MSYQQEQPDSRRTARRLAEAARDRVATHSRASALRDFPEATGSFTQSELPSRRSLRAQQAPRPDGARSSSIERSRPASQEQQLTSRRALRERAVSQPDSVWAEAPLRTREVPRITEQSQESAGLALGEQASRSEELKQWQPPAQTVNSSAQPVLSRRALRAVQSADGDFDENLGGTLTRRQLREQEAALAAREIQPEPSRHTVMEWPEGASEVSPLESEEAKPEATPIPLTRAALRAQQEELRAESEPVSAVTEPEPRAVEHAPELAEPQVVDSTTEIPRRPVRPEPSVVAVQADPVAETVPRVQEAPAAETLAAETLPAHTEQSSEAQIIEEGWEPAAAPVAAVTEDEQNAPVVVESEAPIAALENTARRRWLDEQDSMVRNTPPGGIGLGELSLTGSLYPAALIMPQSHSGLEPSESVNPYMVTGSINLSKKLSETGTIQPLDSYEADNGDDEFSEYSSSAPVGDPMRASNSISAQALDKSVGFAPIKKKNTLAIVMISLGATATLALVTTLAAVLPGLLQ